MGLSNWVISKVTTVIITHNPIKVLINLLTKSQDPPSRSLLESKLRFCTGARYHWTVSNIRLFVIDG